jgi:hypothetical protein
LTLNQLDEAAMLITDTTSTHHGFHTPVDEPARPDAPGRPDATARPASTTRSATTARAIAQFDRVTDRATVAAVGVALHHFAEPLGLHLHLDLHRATTVLTKQARPLIDRPDGLQAIRELVTDPLRVATPDGRTAAEFCGAAWRDVAAVAFDRATSACDGAATFGQMALLNLAVIRGVNAPQPWWGTEAWGRQVEAWADRHSPSRRQRNSIETSPELAPDDVLLDVLSA